MKDFLERVLRQDIQIHKTNQLNDQLPLSFKGKYTLYKVEMSGQTWLAIEPKDETGLIQLRKDRLNIEKISHLNCAIFLKNTTFYIKEKLIDEGIPFVIEGKQVYLPFIGYLLNANNDRKIKPVHLISFLTQKLLLVAIYEKWQNVTVTKAANKLNVSKMSVSRCFDEIAYLNIDILNMSGKSRVVNIPSNIKQLWSDMLPNLRNPVIDRFELIEDIHLENKAGISALCEYSLLSDNYYTTYSVTKKTMTNYEIKKMEQVHKGSKIGCVVLELGYYIDFNDKGLQDPLSVVLSLTKDERQDERIMKSMNEMLEKYVW